MKKNFLKLLIPIVFLIALLFDANALKIDISPPLQEEYQAKDIPLNVVINETYDSWFYSINNNPNVTVCSYNDSETHFVRFDDGIMGSSWLLNGDNDIKIEFNTTVVPQKPHQSVEVCFYLYDNNASQENDFLFSVNNNTIYTIEDAFMPPFVFTWQCLYLNQSDFSNQYTITAWYDNRSPTGGVFIAQSTATAGSSSYFDTGSNNLPPDDISWTGLAGDSDWMVDITIITEPQSCSLNDSVILQAASGQNTLSVYANRTGIQIATDTQSFWVVDIMNASVNPALFLYPQAVNITAEIVADQIQSVYAKIILPNSSGALIEMYDDGNHADGAAGDKIYGTIYNVDIPGQYIVELLATTPYTFMNKSLNFYAMSSNFQILSPQDGSTINNSQVKLSVALPTNVSSWGISVDNTPNETICSYSTVVHDVSVNFTNGTVTSAWNLNGNNDARIVFKESDLPRGKHTSVTFCFNLYDADYSQESNFHFRVNHGSTIYTIPDDASIVAGEYHWVCKAINPADYSSSYIVDFWYEDRSPSGGVYIANDNSIPGTNSLYDNSPQNLPIVNNEYMNWVTYFDDTDWMVAAIISAEEYFCSEKPDCLNASC